MQGAHAPLKLLRVESFILRSLKSGRVLRLIIALLNASMACSRSGFHEFWLKRRPAHFARAMASKSAPPSKNCSM